MNQCKEPTIADQKKHLRFSRFTHQSDLAHSQFGNVIIITNYNIYIGIAHEGLTYKEHRHLKKRIVVE